MNAAAAALAAKAAKIAARELLKLPAPPHGEWRGAYVAERRSDGLWEVVQSQTDPMRLFVTDLGLEFAWAGRLVSDGGFIPKAFQRVKGLHLAPDTYLRTYCHHDALYGRAKVWVREPGGLWHEIPVDRRQADAQLYCGLGAEHATLADAQVIYRAVRMFGHRAWAARAALPRSEERKEKSEEMVGNLSRSEPSAEGASPPLVTRHSRATRAPRRHK